VERLSPREQRTIVSVSLEQGGEGCPGEISGLCRRLSLVNRAVIGGILDKEVLNGEVCSKKDTPKGG